MARNLRAGKTIDDAKQETNVPVSVLIDSFKGVGSHVIATAPLEIGTITFPEVLQVLTRGKRPSGSEQTIVRAYTDVVAKF